MKEEQEQQENQEQRFALYEAMILSGMLSHREAVDLVLSDQKFEVWYRDRAERRMQA